MSVTTRIGGGASPEFEQRWSETIANYLKDPSPAHAVDVRLLAVDFFRFKPGIPAMGPYLGMMDAVAEKNPKIHWRRLHLASLWWFRLFFPKWRPGWNDYWMMRWQLTHSHDAACEIHRRAWHSFLVGDLVGGRVRQFPQQDLERKHAVWESARWMVGSYRRQDPAFNLAMLGIEKTCPLCAGLHGDGDVEAQS